MRPSPSERFHSKVQKSDIGCWKWQGAISSDGYGSFLWRGTITKPHRAAYEIYKGAIPPGMVVMHSCDNRACVNPEHLSVGTQKQNVADCIAKCRRNTPVGHKQRPEWIAKRVAAMRARGYSHCKGGPAHPRAKLTEEQVCLLREMHESGASARTMARTFAISTSAAQMVATNKTYMKRLDK